MWFVMKKKVGGKDCKVCWKRNEKRKGELWVKMELDGWVFKGRVVCEGKGGE